MYQEVSKQLKCKSHTGRRLFATYVTDIWIVSKGIIPKKREKWTEHMNKHFTEDTKGVNKL